MGVKVIHHSKKMGKGVALRLADEKIGESDFYITADCDGQYSPEDIEKSQKNYKIIQIVLCLAYVHMKEKKVRK